MSNDPPQATLREWYQFFRQGYSRPVSLYAGFFWHLFTYFGWRAGGGPGEEVEAVE